MDQPTYNLKEAAKKLGCGYSTLLKRRKNWGIGVISLSRKKKVILHDELVAFQKRRLEKPTIFI